MNQQLTELYSGAYHFKYNYSPTQNNGRIQSMTDVASGETVTYAYDTLNRLLSASASEDPQDNWSQAFGYDGFGNLLSKTGVNAPNVTSWVVDPTTNRITNNGALYYANGNLGQYAGSFYGYDIANQLVMATPQGGSASQRYAYDSSNHRIYAGTTPDGSNYTNEQIYFYGADGKKLGVWSLTWLNSAPVLTNAVINQWFGGRLLKPQDRLQSRGKYFPYGEDRYSPNPANPANDQEKFATYTRDSATGLDYANQRYYGAGLGRFASPDPYGTSAAKQAFPATFNRYGYVSDDPTNYLDPDGSCQASVTAGGETTSSYFDCGVGLASYFRPYNGGVFTVAEWDDVHGMTRRLTQKQLNGFLLDYAKELKGIVSAGELSDCQALAAYLDEADYLSSDDPTQMTRSLALLTPDTTVGQYTILSYGDYVLFGDQSQPSGFAASFQNTYNDDTINNWNGDQGHHFAAFFQLGFFNSNLSATSFNMISTAFEQVQATARGELLNLGDVQLGAVAAQLGADLKNKVVPPSGIGQAIRDAICAK